VAHTEMRHGCPFVASLAGMQPAWRDNNFTRD
jgi:hypothetical protein